MEYILSYFLIAILHFIGVGLNVLVKINQIDKQYPTKTRQEIKALFWDEDWNTVVGSGIVMLLQLTVHLIIFVYEPELTKTRFFYLTGFGIAVVLGYGGQALIYKWLGSAVKVLEQKGDSLISGAGK